MSTKKRFEVGDTVWHATFESTEKWVRCPDCLGQRFAKVTFADGSEVTVECGECAQGFNTPSGIVRIYEHEAKVIPVIIERAESFRGDGDELSFSYSLSDHRGGHDDIFDSEAEAKECAERLAVEWKVSEEARINCKDKPSQTWARNASYHRNCVKRAQKDLEYHTSKLNAAKIYAKETR
jgi:ribosomal protein S27E